MMLLTSSVFLIVPLIACAHITVYDTAGVQPTRVPDPGIYSGLQAFNPVELIPPPIPTPRPPSKFNINLPSGNVPGLSIKHSGAFMGFSIEFAVVDALIGKNATFLQVPFLNLLTNIQQRAGQVNIRLGGGIVDFASLVDDLGSDQTEAVLFGTANTPPLVFTPGLLYTLSNVSALLNVRWYMGIPLNETHRFRTRVAEEALTILGDNLLGLQVGDQPDQYAIAGMRPYNYSPADYMTEFGRLVNAMTNDTAALVDYGHSKPNISLLSRASKILLGPGIVSGYWTPEMVWWAGFPERFKDNLAALAVAHYPSNNCFEQTGVGTYINPQDIFPSFLNHTATVDLVRPYLASARVAQTIEKPLLMIETNTASCGGFPGLSDSFGAALWALDYGLQMAWANFSGAMFHVNGPNSSYNAFVPPSSLDQTTRGWTIGPIYYSTLVMAEIFGSSHESQVLDLNANEGNEFTPAYAVYEHGIPTKVALFNYVTDPSSESDYVVQLSSESLSVLQDPFVSVKYLNATSVAQKHYITWAGQTFGGVYESDGRFKGAEDVRIVACSSSGVCPIQVPAPGFALVSLSPRSGSAQGPAGDEYAVPMKTFATTVSVEGGVSVTLDPEVLATSNGKRVKNRVGRTTRGRGEVLVSGGVGGWTACWSLWVVGMLGWAVSLVL